MLACRTLPGLTWSNFMVQVKLDKERDGFPLTSIREINILLRYAEFPLVVQRGLAAACYNCWLHLALHQLSSHNLAAHTLPPCRALLVTP